MVSRKERKRRADTRKWAVKRYEKHLRHNLIYAEYGLYEYVIILDNLKQSFNIGKIFRSSEAFGVREIHLIGTRYFDTNSAKGSLKWVPVVFHDTFATCYQSMADAGYAMFVLEPEGESILHETVLPAKSAFIFGHEEFGISFDRTDYPEIQTLKIKQVGRVDSLNVSVAASVVMYEYCRQHEKTPSESVMGV